MEDVFAQQVHAAWQERGAQGLARLWSWAALESIQHALLARLKEPSVIVPLVSVVSSSGLFLLFCWASGIAKHSK